MDYYLRLTFFVATALGIGVVVKCLQAKQWWSRSSPAAAPPRPQSILALPVPFPSWRSVAVAPAPSSPRTPLGPSTHTPPPSFSQSKIADLKQLQVQPRQVMALLGTPMPPPPAVPPARARMPIGRPAAGNGPRGSNGKHDAIAAMVTEIVAQQFEVPVDTVRLDSRFGVELNADSLSIVELALALEEAFGLEMPDEDAATIRSVGDAVRWVQERQRPRHKQ
jgi:acyl carrier protein